MTTRFRPRSTKWRARKACCSAPKAPRPTRRYQQGLANGRIMKTEQVVLFNCATGLKYPLPPIHRTLDRHQPIDFAAL